MSDIAMWRAKCENVQALMFLCENIEKVSGEPPVPVIIEGLDGVGSGWGHHWYFEKVEELESLLAEAQTKCWDTPIASEVIFALTAEQADRLQNVSGRYVVQPEVRWKKFPSLS